MARQVALGAGIPVSASAMTINRFCASGLQALALATQAVQTGVHDVVVAGGMESMSFVPMIGHRFTPDPHLADDRPQVYLSMGLTAENVAERFDVSREAQDEWGLRSHLRASAAQRDGRFADEVVSVPTRLTELDGDGRPTVREVAFDADEGIRHDADADQMAGLRPVFSAGRSVTAGNSSQMSDGAAALVVMTGDRAAALGLSPLGRLISFATAGVDPAIMGIRPVDAVPKALSRADSPSTTSPSPSSTRRSPRRSSQWCGSSVSTRRRRTSMAERSRSAIRWAPPARSSRSRSCRSSRAARPYGLVTMCVGGGQGAAGVIEWLGGRQRRAPHQSRGRRRHDNRSTGTRRRRRRRRLRQARRRPDRSSRPSS